MGTRIGGEARVGLCAARWAALRQPARGSSVPVASTELHVTSHVSTPRDYRNNPRGLLYVLLLWWPSLKILLPFPSYFVYL